MRLNFTSFASSETCIEKAVKKFRRDAPKLCRIPSEVKSCAQTMRNKGRCFCSVWRTLLRRVPAARAPREPSGRATRGRTPPGGAASPRAAAGRCAALCGAGGTGRSGAGLLRRRGKAARGRAEPKKTEIKFLCGMQARSGKPNAVSSPVRQKSSCAVRRCGAESGRRRAETDE